MLSPLILAITALLLAVPAAQSSEAAKFAIAREGQAAAAIVIASDAPDTVEFAAEELAYHLKLITGADFPIHCDHAPEGLSPIRVGDSPPARKHGFTPKARKPQEYAIKFSGNELFLVGNDGLAAAPTTPDRNQDFVPKRSVGRFGRAPEFDGNDFLKVPDAGANSEEGTMEFWIRLPEEAPGREANILRIDDRVFERRFYASYIAITQPPGKRSLLVRAHEVSSQENNAETTIESPELDANWHHVRVTWHAAAADPGEAMRLFVDGRPVGSAKWPKARLDGRPLHLGGWETGYHEVLPDLRMPWKGVLDDLRISSKARTDEAVPSGPHANDDDTALLLHLDEDGPAVTDSSRHRRPGTTPRYFEQLGTLHAVYDFLERFAGVRWYAPTEMGIVFDKSPNLAIARNDLRRTPSYAFRMMPPDKLFLPTHVDQLPNREGRLWQLRMRMGGEPFLANHSFNGYHETLRESRPDLFATGYEGEKVRYLQFDWLNPEVLELTIRDARNYFDGNGLHYQGIAVGDLFAVVPMDASSWSKAPATQAEMNETERDNEQFANGRWSNHWFGFVNKVAAALAESHPGKRLSTLAYKEYSLPPDRFGLAPGVDVMFCLATRNWWVPSVERADRRVFDKWRAESNDRRLYAWIYDCAPVFVARGWNCFPGFYAKQMISQMRWMMEAPNLRGFFVQHAGGFRGSFLLDQVEEQIRFRMMWDRDVEPDSLYNEFFARYYGPAAGPMRQFYELVEQTYTNPENYPEEVRTQDKMIHQTEDMAWNWLGTPERMNQLRGFMREASALATEEPYKTRVAWFEKGIWDYMAEGRKAYLKKSLRK